MKDIFIDVIVQLLVLFITFIFTFLLKSLWNFACQIFNFIKFKYYAFIKFIKKKENEKTCKKLTLKEIEDFNNHFLEIKNSWKSNLPNKTQRLKLINDFESIYEIATEQGLEDLLEKTKNNIRNLYSSHLNSKNVAKREKNKIMTFIHKHSQNKE